MPTPYAIQTHMAQMRFQVTPVVTDNLHEPETAFVCPFREDNWPHQAPFEQPALLKQKSLRCEHQVQDAYLFPIHRNAYTF